MGTRGYEGVLICIIPPQNGGGDTLLPPTPPKLSCVGTRVCTCARPPVSHGHTLRLCPGWVGELWGPFGETPPPHQLGEGNGGALPPTFSSVPVAPGTWVWSHTLDTAGRWDGDPPPTEPGAPWCAGWGAHGGTPIPCTWGDPDPTDAGGPRSHAWGDPSYAHTRGPQSYTHGGTLIPHTWGPQSCTRRGTPTPCTQGDPNPGHTQGRPPILPAGGAFTAPNRPRCPPRVPNVPAAARGAARAGPCPRDPVCGMRPPPPHAPRG